MKKLCLIFIFLVGQFAFSQNKSEHKDLKSFLEPIIKSAEAMKNVEKVIILVDGKEIKNPEKYEFDLVLMKEMKVFMDSQDKVDPKKYSYTIAITTNKS